MNYLKLMYEFFYFILIKFIELYNYFFYINYKVSLYKRYYLREIVIYEYLVIYNNKEYFIKLLEQDWDFINIKEHVLLAIENRNLILTCEIKDKQIDLIDLFKSFSFYFDKKDETLTLKNILNFIDREFELDDNDIIVFLLNNNNFSEKEIQIKENKDIYDIINE